MYNTGDNEAHDISPRLALINERATMLMFLFLCVLNNVNKLAQNPPRPVLTSRPMPDVWTTSIVGCVLLTTSSVLRATSSQ